MGGRGAASGRTRKPANIGAATGEMKVGGEYSPKLSRVGNSDFYQDEYGTNNIKKITQGAYAGAWRAEMAVTPKDGIPEGVRIPPSQTSYHTNLNDAKNSIQSYHKTIQEYVKRNKS